MKIKRYMTAAVLPTGAAARERKDEIHAKTDERLAKINARAVERPENTPGRREEKLAKLSASDRPQDQEKAKLLAWRRDHPQEASLSRSGLLSVTVKRGHLRELGADKGYIAGAKAFLDDGTGSRHTLTRVVTVAGAFTKKKTGHGTLTIVMADGSTVTCRVSAEKVGSVAPWIHAFNAYAATLPAVEPV